MIDIAISKDAQALIGRITDTRGLLRAVAREMDLQNQFTIEHISAERMRGNNGKPFPVSDHKLGIRTSHLVKSIRASKSIINGDGITSTIGSNVKYAGIHEFGFNGSVMVAGHVRKRFAVREFLGAQKTAPVFKPSATTRRRGESNEAFFARAKSREDFARRRFDEKLNAFNFENRDSRVIRRKVRVGDQNVKTHQRKVNMPARAPFRFGLQDRSQAIGDALNKSIIAFWNKTGGAA
jgi:phage gpG-like protein